MCAKHFVLFGNASCQANRFQSGPFEQALRDVFAATAHITFHGQTMEQAGQAMLGAPIGSPIF